MRTVLFDVDGVLVHGYTARAEKRRRWDEHMEADLGIDPHAFRDSFIKGVFVQDVLTGRTALLTALEEVLPRLGFHGSPFALVSYWLTRDSHVNYQLLDVVRRLRGTGTVRLCVATNQEHMRAFHLWNRLGFETLFDDMFHSARLGALKPDPAFFQKVAQIIGPQEEPPLIFDDSEAVIDGARAFGWEAVHYGALADCVGHPWIAAALAGEG